jgi:hypothetical protein
MCRFPAASHLLGRVSGEFQDRCLKPLGHPSKVLISVSFMTDASDLKTPLLSKLLPTCPMSRLANAYQDLSKLARAWLIASAALSSRFRKR